MRVCHALLAFALLLSGCATADVENVQLVVFNESGLQQSLRISIDGERVLDEIATVSAKEPAIVSTAYLHLRTGPHRIVVMRNNVEKGLTFVVRGGTRTNVRVHVSRDDIGIAVAYGDSLYI